MIDVAAIFSDQRDEIPKGGECSDIGISFSEVLLFVAFNYYACFVSYGAVWIVLRLVDSFGANCRASQLHCFPGVDSCECVIELNRCGFFFHCSFRVVSLWAVHGVRVCEWIAVDGCRCKIRLP
jgi:hypothetical protein